MKYTGDNLDEVLAAHKRWLTHADGWKKEDKAEFYETDLRYIDLSGKDLSYANFNRADLDCARLYDTKLYGAKLHYANLRNADMRETDLRCADLGNADMRWVNLRYAKLGGADIRGAVLYNADLRYAEDVPFIPHKCPEEGSFIGWKKASDICSVIVKLQIPEDAKRSSATSDKCRCSKAIVLAIENLDGTPYERKAARSKYDPFFWYVVGETVEVKDFDEDRWNECSTGIHFFINRQQAVEY